MTFWYGCGCGSSDPYLELMDRDRDPDLALARALVVSDLEEANNNKIFLYDFMLIPF